MDISGYRSKRRSQYHLMLVFFQYLLQFLLATRLNSQHIASLLTRHEFTFHPQPIISHFFAAIVVYLLPPNASLSN